MAATRKIVRAEYQATDLDLVSMLDILYDLQATNVPNSAMVRFSKEEKGEYYITVVTAEWFEGE